MIIMRDTWCRTCMKVTDREQSLVILENLLPEQYSHTVCSYESIGDDNFKAAIKLNLSSEEEAKRWLEDFQSSSGITWRTSKTYPNVGRYNKYRVDYRCRTIKKNTSCPATLFLILKRKPEWGERKSRSGDPHMKEGLILHINLRNVHNHRFSCAEASTRRHISGETTEKLKMLFESGHSPSSALKVLKCVSQEEQQDSKYVHASADRSVCPDLQFCYRLYYKLFKKAYDTATGEEMFKDLQQTLDEYNKEQGVVCARLCKTTDNQLVIAICTPLMRRVHARLRESCEMVFVVSSRNERLNHHLFLLLTYSLAGGLPLGVFITTSETQATVSAAVQLLRTVFPPDKFFGHPEGPLVAMTDDCTALREALREAFPDAALGLCAFHLLQAMWRWLWRSSNGVPVQHRAQLLESVRDLVHASTPTALMEAYDRLMEDHIASRHQKFVQHLQEVFKRREEWAVCLQAQLSTRGNYINNCVESALRVVKEKVLHRLKSYNVTQLVNFVVTRMEAYYTRCLTHVASNRLQTSPRRAPRVTYVERHSIVQVDRWYYTVTSLSNPAVCCHVDTAVSCCTCPAGITGGHCKHQSAVARRFGHKNGPPHCPSPDTRKLYHQIATGRDVPDDGSGRFQTLVLKETSLSEGAAGVCAGGMHCCPRTEHTDADGFHEPMESPPIQMQPTTSVETDPGDVSLKERLSSVFLDLTKKLDNPDFIPSITSFVRTYESIGTDGAMMSALSSFGGSPPEEARGCKGPRRLQQTSAHI